MTGVKKKRKKRGNRKTVAGSGEGSEKRVAGGAPECEPTKKKQGGDTDQAKESKAGIQ